MFIGFFLNMLSSIRKRYQEKLISIKDYAAFIKQPWLTIHFTNKLCHDLNLFVKVDS